MKLGAYSILQSPMKLTGWALLGLCFTSSAVLAGEQNSRFHAQSQSVNLVIQVEILDVFPKTIPSQIMSSITGKLDTSNECTTKPELNTALETQSTCQSFGHTYAIHRQNNDTLMTIEPI